MYVLYGEGYSRRTSVSGRQHTEGVKLQRLSFCVASHCLTFLSRKPCWNLLWKQTMHCAWSKVCYP